MEQLGIIAFAVIAAVCFDDGKASTLFGHMSTMSKQHFFTGCSLNGMHHELLLSFIEPKVLSVCIML